MTTTAVSARRKLLDRFWTVIDDHATAVAVRDSERAWTYGELGALTVAIRRALDGRDPAEPVGLLLERSAEAYAALWAAVSLGRPYVPLNPMYPAARLADIVDQAGVRDIVASSATVHCADALGVAPGRLIIADDLDPVRIGEGIDDGIGPASAGGDLAYVLFTSGSTGRPKGVPITYANLAAFVEAMAATIPLRPGDRCSQVCELSFDFSVHEIYLGLLSGATLCPARRIDLFNPGHYAARHGLTVWISVPSLARVALDGPAPIGDQLATLRLTIFNGEPLTSSLTARWQAAAPDSVIWNTYGPTECTVAATAHRWTGAVEPDVVAIGSPLPGCRTALLVGAGVIPTEGATDGATGELLLAGPQRFAGYLDATLASPFVTDEHGDTWYRTGDRVRWRDDRLHHLGRLDQQVKIGGHRIELPEVEHRLRAALGTEHLAVVAHPRTRPTELVLVVGGPPPGAITPEATGLPRSMLPRRVVTVPSLPTNPNGKLDRPALQVIAGSPP